MKILIADDELTMQTILTSGLARLGYEVEVASNGKQAWEALQRPDAPEMAILDWQMPGMTGVDICQRLRQRKDSHYVYVILLTGLDTLNDLVAGFEAGADDYMTKPFKAAELNARLRSGRRVLDLQRELLAAQEQLKVLANYDSLTNLWNRRFILERLVEELVRADRDNSSLGIVVADIDHFKHINDTLGHATGDEALQEVAKRLTAAIRPYDSLGRYGGEEFLLVVPNCEIAESITVAERVRQALCATPITTSRGELAVTASFGVSATVAGQPADARALIVAADRALYRAKVEGRNRVCIAAPDDELAAEGNGK